MFGNHVLCLLIEQHGDNLMINLKASNNPVTPSLGVMLNRLWYCQDYPDPYPPPPINQFNTLLGFSWCDISVVSWSDILLFSILPTSPFPHFCGQPVEYI